MQKEGKEERGRERRRVWIRMFFRIGENKNFSIKKEIDPNSV